MEGAEVKAGQVLVEIDPARYNLAVRAARATLERMTATQAEAAAGLERREAEGAEGVFSKEDVASWRSRAATTAAQVAEAKVAVDQALLNLRDAYVRAPSRGRSRRAPCRRASTCLSAPCSRRSCAATRSCSASRSPPPTPCGSGPTWRRASP